ncbi:hypothetical protein WJX74_005223 [Apatococcus lobatus]|uniref:Complex 1 LYR protein domain-containing protein n=1 Tax=Apatococcus lobatus TaxID=904363 RepID=A0AAW1REX5_9CHLO
MESCKLASAWPDMVVGTDAKKALKLFRDLLKTAKIWKVPHEQKYIREEARAQFIANQHLKEPTEIAARIQDGMERLEYALHYGIPYPRLEHVKQFTVRQYEEKPQDSVESPRITGQSKLDQALARKAREKKAQQHHEN